MLQNKRGSLLDFNSKDLLDFLRQREAQNPDSHVRHQVCPGAVETVPLVESIDESSNSATSFPAVIEHLVLEPTPLQDASTC